MSTVLDALLNILRGFGSVFDLAGYIPEILRESGSLFGVFALVAILIAILVVFFFKNSEDKQKERVFLYTALFLLALVFSSLIAGVSTGFQTGRDVATIDPAVIELSPTAAKKLENHLSTTGQNITSQNKANVIAIALSEYLDSSQTSTQDSNQIRPIPIADTVANTDEQAERISIGLGSGNAPEGFLFESTGCEQNLQTITCDTLITNTKEDIDFLLFADGHRSNSRLIDDAGNQYVPEMIQVGNRQSPYYISVSFARDVPVKVSLIAKSPAKKPVSISLAEILGQSEGRRMEKADLSFQARNIPITK